MQNTKTEMWMGETEQNDGQTGWVPYPSLPWLPARTCCSVSACGRVCANRSCIAGLCSAFMSTEVSCQPRHNADAPLEVHATSRHHIMGRYRSSGQAVTTTRQLVRNGKTMNACCEACVMWPVSLCNCDLWTVFRPCNVNLGATLRACLIRAIVQA